MVNLAVKYGNKLAEAFTKESVIKGRLSTAFDWAGAKTVRVLTALTVEMGDYNRAGANRFGNPTELQDVVQEMPLTQDKSFALAIDKGNNADQYNLKEAGRIMKLQQAEKQVPAFDKYVLDVLAHKGGTIAGNSTALTKSNIAERVVAGIAALDNAEAPEEGRTIYIDPAKYALLRLSPEFLAADALAEKSVGKGHMGEFGGCAVVKVPAGRMPANVNFMIVHKEAAIAPEKLASAKIHKDPPGIDGNLLEGRHYYDAFVIGARAGGVYVDVNTASGGATVCAAPTLSSTTLASAGNTIAWTADGTDPRYSNTATVGTSVASAPSGATIKAYAYKAGSFPSAVAEFTLASA